MKSSVRHLAVMALAMLLGCTLITAACLAVPTRIESLQRVSSSMQGQPKDSSSGPCGKRQGTVCSSVHLQIPKLNQRTK